MSKQIEGKQLREGEYGFDNGPTRPELGYHMVSIIQYYIQSWVMLNCKKENKENEFKHDSLSNQIFRYQLVCMLCL